MRWPILALFLILVLPTIQYGLSSTGIETGESKDSDMNSATSVPEHAAIGPLISEVMPAFEVEYVMIRNTGSGPIDLDGMILSDGEGSIAFSHLILLPGEEQALCSDLALFERIHDHHPSISIDDPALAKKGRFILADAGDELLLMDRNLTVIDALAYGASDYAGPGWLGDPCTKPGMGKALARVLVPDSDRSIDWCVTVPGRAEIEPISASSIVEPFIFPEQGRTRVLRELAYAHSSVRLAIYELSDQHVVGALLECSRRGVDVRLLVEAEPVGGRSGIENGALDALQSSGADVYLMKSYHGYKRFAYLHCKYLVIDERRLLVMSENLIASSLDGNRGWGAMVESSELSRLFTAMFDSDSLIKRPDIQAYCQSGSAFVPLLNESAFHLEGIISARANVSAVISPDWSLRSLLYSISMASDRILVEQLFLEERLLRDLLLPALSEAAKRGVDVRVLLDKAWYNQMGTKNNTLAAQLIEQEGERLGTPLQAKIISDYQRFEALHNKGMVIDGSVLVSSINWNYAAMQENRECGVLIESYVIADFFAQVFEDDWKDDPYPPNIRLRSASLEVKEGETVLISAGDCSDESGISRVEWDLSDDGTIDQAGRLYRAELHVGDHLIRLTVFDGFNNSATELIKVHVVAVAVAGGQELALMALATASTIAAWRVLVRIKRH